MNKNVDYLKDILQHTMNLNRLRWAYEELLINEHYYKHMYNDNKKRIDKAIENIEEYKSNYYSTYDENEIEVELIDKLLDILKGSDREWK